ncbi:ATP-binding protein [Streptomyces roseifaciens]
MSGRTANKTFRAVRPSVPQAREYVGLICLEWKISAELTASAKLLVSELATNVIRHAEGIGDFFELGIRRRKGVLILEVTDSSTERIPEQGMPPVSDDVADLDQVGETGRGLFLVGHFSDGWGVRPRPNGPGKTVWAHLSTTKGESSSA